jgi:hypothetical protein
VELKFRSNISDPDVLGVAWTLADLARPRHSSESPSDSRAGVLNGSAVGPQFAPLGGCWRVAICAGQSNFVRSDPAWPNLGNDQCEVPLERVGGVIGSGWAVTGLTIGLKGDGSHTFTGGAC